MTGIKRSGTWTKKLFGTIWHTEAFPDAEHCLMCVHQIPHSLKEHAAVLAKWPKPKELHAKVRAIHVCKPITTEARQLGKRRQRERREFRRQVWAKS